MIYKWVLKFLNIHKIPFTNYQKKKCESKVGSRMLDRTIWVFEDFDI